MAACPHEPSPPRSRSVRVRPVSWLRCAQSQTVAGSCRGKARPETETTTSGACVWGQTKAIRLLCNTKPNTKARARHPHKLALRSVTVYLAFCKCRQLGILTFLFPEV